MHSTITFVLVMLVSAGRLYAQPYLDIAAVKYQHSPDAGGLRRSYAANQVTYSNAALNIPVVFKDSSVFVCSPSVEKWDIESKALAGVPPVFKGMAMQLSFVKPLHKKWTTTVVFNPRWNGERLAFKNKLLPAGAFLMSRKKSNTFTYKFGLYYHKEYYGNIFVPLVGIDWKISGALKLFGILPGNLVLEKKASRFFYYGAAFRANTASYEYEDLKKFIRIDENQLQAFADWYVAKNIVLNAEAGHSLFRRFRTGTANTNAKYEMHGTFNDNVLLRVAVLYRMRFD